MPFPGESVRRGLNALREALRRPEPALPGRILVIARTPETAESLGRALDQAGFKKEVLHDVSLAFSVLDRELPVLVLAENSRDGEGMEPLKEALRGRAAGVPWLVYLPSKDVAVAIQRMSEGAYDCLCPPLSADDVGAAVRRAVSRAGGRPLTKGTLPLRRPAVWAGAGVLGFLFLLALGLSRLWSPPFQVYPLPASKPAAVAGAGDRLWVLDQGLKSVTALKTQGDYISVLETFRPVDHEPLALAAAEDGLYTLSKDGQLRRLRPPDYAPDLSVPAPGRDGVLAWDGQSLWFCEAGTGRLYYYAPDLTVRQIFQAPTTRPAGMAWNGATLWVADRNGSLWEMEYQGSDWRRRGPYELAALRKRSGASLSGVAFWRGALWFVSDGGGALVQHRVPEAP